MLSPSRRKRRYFCLPSNSPSSRRSGQAQTVRPMSLPPGPKTSTCWTGRGVLAIVAGVIALIAGLNIPLSGLTLIGVALTNLYEGGTIQLPLPFDQARAATIDATVDDVRDRFGSSALTRAVLLGRDPGWTMPMLPD